MTTISARVGVITLFQRDLDQATAFYTRLFGKAPDFADADSAIFRIENTIIQLETESAARDGIAPARVADPGAGSRTVLTIWVDDANAACAELAELGVRVINGPSNTPWGTRRAAFADPGGHIWRVVQDLDPQPNS